MTSAPLPPLASQVQRYLHDVLGTAIEPPGPWPRLLELPYFLQDAFHWREIALCGHPVVLALDRGESKLALREVRSKLDKARVATNQPILYVTDALASYERRQLIEHKTPFIVPGNQLYLPDLGIDLREYFRQRLAAPAVLAPAAQAVLITMLLAPDQPAWHPGDLARVLDYTPMTVSRATRELVKAELVTVQDHGRVGHLSLHGSPAEAWERAQPLLRSPIKRVTWAVQVPGETAELSGVPLAGASALACYSLLADPRAPVYAAGPAHRLAPGLDFLPEWVPGAIAWQAWSYHPPTFKDGRCVDPLSLALSLRAEPDERIQIALDELRGAFPW